MKKFLLPLLLLPLALFSCSDDNDLPDVSFSVDVEGATVVDGSIYVVKGDTFEITSVNVKNNEPNKFAGVTDVVYYFDGRFLGVSPVPPYGFTFVTTENTPVGSHSIDVKCTVLAVGKSIATAVLAYDVQVVDSPDDIPATDNPSATISATPSIQEKTD